MSKQVYRKNGRKPASTLAVLFLALVFGAALLNLFWPKRTELALENRKAAQFPTFKVSALLDGSWQKAFGTWMQDQVMGRDQWVNLQRAADEAVFQKTEEGGILLGKNHWMFTRQFSEGADVQAQTAKNVAAVSEFASRYPGKVTFLLAPSAAVIYPEALPAGAPMIDENENLDAIFAQIGQTAQVLDLRDTFTAHKEDYLYFKTDHHWTTQGAYLAYQQFCALKGLTPFAGGPSETVPDFLGTHYSSTRLWNVQPDTITWYPMDNQMTVYKLTGEARFEVDRVEPMINTEKFATRDKYAAFLDGNNGYSVIEGSGEGSILVVKDSYANSFVPYLTANYAKIGVVDFRGFAYGLDSTIEKEGYDDILVLYNYQTFVSDNKVIYINRPTTLS